MGELKVISQKECIDLQHYALSPNSSYQANGEVHLPHKGFYILHQE